MISDTIVNIATPRGYGAIGVIRISGENALDILKKLIQKETHIEPRLAKHLFLKDKDNSFLGDAIVIYYKAPNSYTGEDVVEIQILSSPVLMERILELIIEYGARLSRPGEFTERAFLNGKIDLVRAESINRIVYSQDLVELKSSLNKFSGKLTEEIKKIIEELNEIVLNIEASISFPDDVELMSEVELFDKVKRNVLIIEKILEKHELSKPFVDGIKLTLFGKANVGKSSLFNIFMEEERVIVSEVPGTTRDIIKERIYINSLPIDIIDTAGVIREIENELDKIAQERSEKVLDTSDLIILMFDGSRELNEDDFYAIEKVKKKNFIPVINKNDLPKAFEKEELEKIIGKDILSISCLTKDGIDKLKREITKIYQNRPELNEIFYINSREKNLFIEAKNFLNEILFNKPTIDEISFLLKDSIKKLKEIIGEEFNQDTLKEIFSKFCIGK
ncbi:MAG: tRNA uridine-5-carboxymethylaminomethyl(34) synthesis GTPase MnmE [Caldisericia bacterium]|jgi:tRNA modification GTPase|nr:tRNA uridine-5-carboxymethylaminomethyl(34) synthesis GTPase MnmE [Caldisericia bacterium]